MKSFYLLVWLSLLNTIVFGQRAYEITTAADVDDGNCSAAHCSLREAINAANADGVANVIRFDIRGNGPQVIYLNSELPAIRDRETIIDATTEINNFPTSGLVILDGGNMINTGLSIQASDVHVFGLQFQNFLQAGIAIGDGVNEISEIVIGEASKGNILIKNGIAIHIQKAKTTTIQSNYIGTDLNYAVGLGNKDGLIVNNEIESEIFVGGNAADGEGNIFANHQEAAINLSYKGYASIAGNRIGTAYNQERIGNKIGILSNNPSGALDIGGSATTKNIIANNEKGISIEVSDNLSISQNDFNCNTKSLENLFRKYAPPVFEYGIETIIIGTSSPNDIVELYLSEGSCGEGSCEALTFLGQVRATPDGTWNYPSFYRYGQHVVALSRNSQNTSEFSECLRVCPVELNAHASTAEKAVFCKGESIELKGDYDLLGRQWVTIFDDSDFEYHWKGPNGYASDQQHITDITEEGPYVLEAKLFGCGSTLDTVDIKIADFELTAGNTGPYCEATSFDLTSTVVTNMEEVTYEWTGPNNFQSSDPNPINVGELGTYHLKISAAGCESETATTAVINHDYPNFSLGADQTICEGETVNLGLAGHQLYQWSASEMISCDTCESVQITPSKTTKVVLTAGDYENCVNKDSIIIAVTPALRTAEDQTLCPNTSLVIFDTVVQTAGSYSKNYVASSGCDSIHTVHVRQLEENKVFSQATICEGDSYSVFGVEQTETNQYSQTFVAANGCDSVHTIDLVVLPTIFNEEIRSLCEGEVSTIFGVNQDTTGIYTKTFQTYTGCDSIHTVQLIVHPQKETTQTITACEGESVLFFGQEIQLAGRYTRKFASVAGCDSTHHIDVDFQSYITTIENRPICEGETTLVFGTLVDTSGTFENTFISQYGCDSIHTVQVFQAKEQTVAESITICEGTTFNAFGEEVERAGVYERLFTSQDGCDSTHIYTLDVLTPSYSQEERIICEGESSFIFGVSTQETGSFSENYSAFNGCDSTHTIHLQVLEKFSTSEEISICEGGTYLLFDSTAISTAGIFKHTFTAANGCDSLHEVVLNVLQQSSSQERLQACEGESVEVFGNLETTSGTFTKTFTNANGCDSVHIIEVDILQPVSIIQEALICAQETFFFENDLLSTTGTYTKTYAGLNGCDSIHTVQLTIQEQIATTETIRLCEGESISLFGKSTNSAGIYSENFLAEGGCDSTHTFIVEKVSPVVQETEHFFCEGDLVVFYEEAIVNTTSIQNVYTGSNGCDSTHINHITIHQREVIETVQTVCQNECTTLYDATICASGIWKQDLTNQQGCDSTHIVLLTILEPVFTSESITLCAGDSATVFGDYLQEEGSYTNSFIGSNGCDSTHTIELSRLSDLQIATTQKATCPLSEDGEIEVLVTGSAAPYSYEWAHSTSNQAEFSSLSAGNYSLTVTDANNCIKTENFILEAFELPNYEIVPIHISCNGVADGAIEIYTTDSLNYQWSESIYTTETTHENLIAGQYDLKIVDQNNCSYSESIRLIEPPVIQLELPEEISIQLGQTIELTPAIIYPKPVDYEWSVPIATDCNNCPNLTIRPFRNTTVQLTVYDENNCEAQQETLIRVDQTKDIYIPNAFSPNGDSQNDVFMIQSGSHPVQNIDVFRVYDRWGTLLFDATNIQPNAVDFGWDGTFDGQPMGVGVYIYYTKVQFVDGTTEFYEGDVTLTR